MVPLVAFINERLPMFPEVPTLREKGAGFSYFMQRSIVGAPGTANEARAYYTELFTKVYNSKDRHAPFSVRLSLRQASRYAQGNQGQD